MTIRVTIDRLILDGLPVDRAAAPHVRAAVEAELTRLLTAGEWHPPGGAVPSLTAAPINLGPPTPAPGEVGTAIAGAVYGGFRG